MVGGRPYCREPCLISTSLCLQIRVPAFLDLFMQSLFKPGSKINQDHKHKYIHILAYAASVVETWKKVRGTKEASLCGGGAGLIRPRPHESKTKPVRFETTFEGGLRSLRFRSADSLASCGRKAEPHKTFCGFAMKPASCGRGLRTADQPLIYSIPDCVFVLL